MCHSSYAFQDISKWRVIGDGYYGADNVSSIAEYRKKIKVCV
jgi:hypothetical protein